MPGKPQQGKKKRLHQSKKSRAIQRFGTPSRPAEIAETVPSPAEAAAPLVPKRPAPAAKAISTQHQYVVKELRRIGTLAGIILVILVIAAITIP
jgi:hypothetical protein